MADATQVTKQNLKEVYTAQLAIERIFSLSLGTDMLEQDGDPGLLPGDYLRRAYQRLAQAAVSDEKFQVEGLDERRRNQSVRAPRLDEKQRLQIERVFAVFQKEPARSAEAIDHLKMLVAMMGELPVRLVIVAGRPQDLGDRQWH